MRAGAREPRARRVRVASMLVIGALILTVIVAGLLTYRPPRNLGEPSPPAAWAGAVGPALVFLVGNVLLVAVSAATAALVGIVLMAVGVVLLMRNRRRASR